ncbi:putative intracellular protease/amidase [Nocardiopsis mwathae]|uniref:Putative intracellular protease/amidase n=1 Tax=Nocardiopsis mwathae TaxID=1472723 RepID=A0A7W9YGD6_9ACTN|nr:DJ-1/PfpI family protein [Nocardiopsis mwathae]MBB6171643.1 putative intracellular protease/amidase [Nocardiopsis mwathae]
MRIAILLYDGIAALDAVGPYEVLTHLPDTEVVHVGRRRGEVRTGRGSLGLTVDAELGELPDPDVILVPGGPGQRDLMTDGPVHDWLRATDATSTWTTSVCTGSLVLAAAGLLQGRRATTYWLALGELPALGAVPVEERVVFDGKYVTAAGVSSGIDMALSLAGAIAGDATAREIQLAIEYDPRPPHRSGSPATAPADLVTALRERSRFTATPG